jgi:ketosteroid isomerase-like protein
MPIEEEEQVLAANAEFYRAFSVRDADAMDAMWARSAPVACIHPGWQSLNGRDAVMASWRGIFAGPAPTITCSEPLVHLLGPVAFVICLEEIPDGTLIATNVFVREDSAWRLCHHQAGPVAHDPDDDAPRSGFLN